MSDVAGLGKGVVLDVSAVGLEGLEKNSNGSLCVGQDSNHESRECMLGALSPQLTCFIRRRN